jgi:hypothetical protein
MTVDMTVAEVLPQKNPEKVKRSWIIRQKSDNLADQLSLKLQKPKQDVVSEAIIITAVLTVRNPELISEILDEFRGSI